MVDVFGVDYLSDEHLSSLVKATIPAVDPQVTNDGTEGPDSKRIHLSPGDGGVVLHQLELLESSLQNGDTPEKEAIFREQRKNDLIRAALVNAIQRIKLLMNEITGYRSQVHQLSREQASLQYQIDHPAAEESQVESVAPPQPAVESPKAVETPVNDEQLAKEVKALKVQVDERGTYISQLESKITQLESSISELRSEKRHVLYDLDAAKDRIEVLMESRNKEVDAMRRSIKSDVSRAQGYQESCSSLLSKIEEKMKSDRTALEEEKKSFQKEKEELEQSLKQMKLERDGYEGKLKRRKLFADTISQLEAVIAKLRKVIKAMNVDRTDQEAHVRILKEQLKDMSDAFKACDGTLHKTKKLVEFGDKKNDQLLSEYMEMQKLLENQRIEMEHEKQANEKLQQEHDLLKAEVDRLREAGKHDEEVMMDLREEAESVKKSVLEMVGEEESYRGMWKRSERKREELEKRIAELQEINQNLKLAGKKDRTRFVPIDM